MTSYDQLLCLYVDKQYTVSELQNHIKVLQQLHITGSPICNNEIECNVVAYITRNELQSKIHTSNVHRRNHFNDQDQYNHDITVNNGTHTSSSTNNNSSLTFNQYKNTLCLFSTPDVTQQNSPKNWIDLSDCLYNPNASNTSETIHVNHTISMQRLHDLFTKLGLRYVFVTKYGKLHGFCTKKDILNTLKQQSKN
jgi:predicted transcriptional regulator